MTPDISHLNQIITWLVPFVFTSPAQTTIAFKSGNKAYGLSGSTGDVGGTGNTYGVSEVALKRKYRYTLVLFTTTMYSTPPVFLSNRMFLFFLF